VNRPIIGLSGKLKSGKSEAAKKLHHRGFTIVKFAGALKQMMTVIGLTQEEIEGNLKELPCELLCGKSPRWAMQSIGTDWGRDMIGKDFWVNVWKRHVESYHGAVPVVADDVRFQNEADAIRSLGGIVVRIVRPNLEIVSGHASEAIDFKSDMTIQNDGTLDGFHHKISMLCDERVIESIAQDAA
jgi:hypothetical protein